MREWCAAEKLALESIPNAQLIGTDESGITAYAGPVSAAAVEPDPKSPYESIVVDCKLLDSKQLAEAYREVIIKSRRWACAYASVTEVDSLGIWRASQLAMRRAVRQILDDTRNTVLLVDHSVLPGMHCLQWPLLNGDSIAACVSAASIVAKYSRDILMVELAAKHPQYGWERNKGTCTTGHKEAVKTHGKTIWHRKTWTTRIIKERQAADKELMPNVSSDPVLTTSSDVSKLNQSYVSLDSTRSLDPKSTAPSTAIPMQVPKSTLPAISDASPATNSGTSSTSQPTA